MCTIFASSSAGIMSYYGLLQLAVWWFCHVVSLFWGIQFPFRAQSLQAAGRVKYIHITMVIVGLVLPTLPVVVAFTAGNPDARGFGLVRFPTFICTSLQRDPTFYSLVLPVNILAAIGVPLLIIIFWIIHKVHTCQVYLTPCDSCLISLVDHNFPKATEPKTIIIKIIVRSF